MFTFNRNEQIVLILLSAALLIGLVVNYLDRINPNAIPDFQVQKGAVPVPDMPKAAPQTPTGPININQASAQELQHLSGIGPQMAQRIVDYRQQHGNFTTLEDLTNVKGIGSKTLDRLRPHITLSSP